MDNSKMAKANTTMEYDMFKHDKGRSKLSREIDTRKVCKCSEKDCHCNCNSIGDPLTWVDGKVGGRIA
jgi:hypothetical protein